MELFSKEPDITAKSGEYCKQNSVDFDKWLSQSYMIYNAKDHSKQQPCDNSVDHRFDDNQFCAFFHNFLLYLPLMGSSLFVI